ncbi:glycerol-3-phosphate 1-O-acyltransferase PlsY [uncultured Ruminococcus sp.]|uniref:glycerol-3-phosphate 1-O-acyltransferase PlsY n=1 Tax=uncultured Ruminococcus sp. TaxID=165186 RepID=UPI00292DFDD4|nr:glycerol-3-phosphate 1-O-acyltransferase PlsY [uncultured Ruminococcus sp.]
MTVDLIIRTLATIIIAYLLGSLNPAIMITKLKTGKDIRTMGSGNAGFTNVLRSVGKGPAIATIVFDYLKGIVAVLIGWWLFSTLTVTNDVSPIEYVKYGRYLAGLFVILGHSFPIFYGFKGGKSVVTANALMLVVDWRVFLMILGTFLIIFFITKLVSLGSIACAMLYPVYTLIITYFCDYLPALVTENELRFRFVLISTACAFLVGAIVIFRHKDNLKRLFNGEEKRIKAKK